MKRNPTIDKKTLEWWFIDYLVRHLNNEVERRLTFDNSWTDKPMTKEMKCPIRSVPVKSAKRCTKKFNTRDDLWRHFLREHTTTDIANRLSYIVENIYNNIIKLEPVMEECKLRAKNTKNRSVELPSVKFEFETLADFHEQRIKDMKRLL